MLRIKEQKHIPPLAVILTAVLCLSLSACRASEPAVQQPVGDTVQNITAGGSLPDLEELKSYGSLSSLDLGTLEPDPAYLEQVWALYPDCDIRFQVKIGGEIYPSDAVTVVSGNMSAEDVGKLYVLKSLQTVDARGSGCVEELKKFA